MPGTKTSGNHHSKVQRDKVQKIINLGWHCIENYLKSSQAKPQDKANLAVQICKRQVANITKETGNVAPKSVINIIKNHLPEEVKREAGGNGRHQRDLGVQPKADVSA